MGSFSNYTENKVLDHIFGGSGVAQQFTPPAYLYVGLLTNILSAASGDANLVTEVPSSYGYSRLAVANTTANWTTAVSGTKYNSQSVVFPAANGGSWGTLVGVGIYDAVTDGNLIVWSSGLNKTIDDGDIAFFVASGININLD